MTPLNTPLPVEIIRCSRTPAAASGMRSGQAAVERRPVYENGKPVYDGQNVKTVSVETVRYKTTPIKYAPPSQRAQTEIKAPKLKR